MFKTWSKKKKIKAVFQLHFQATEVPKLKKPALMISLVADDVGKTTVKLPKTKTQDGICTWENPVYEPMKFVEESKSGKLKEKIYHFIVSAGSSKSGYLGEASVDFVDFVAETEPLTVSLPLKFANSGVILHVTILRVNEDGDFRELDDSEDLSRHSSVDIQNSNWDIDGSNRLSYTDNGGLDRTSNAASSVSPQTKGAMPQSGNTGTTVKKLTLNWSSDESSFGSPIWVEDKPPTEKVKDFAGDPIEKLRQENAMLMRQADTSELELPALRKKVAKETSQGQNLSRQIISLKEERDALKLECQQLKSSRGRGEEVHASQRQLETMKQELSREKKVKANLHSQLQTTQDSNSELVLVVKDLEESLVMKDKEIADLLNELETEKNSKSMGNFSIRKTDEGAEEVESLKQKLRELLTEMDAQDQEKEDQDMHIKRLTLDYNLLKKKNNDLSEDYNLLKKKNNDLSLKLDRNQERLRTEIENERAGYITTIEELESHVKRSEETIEKQVHEFAECLISIQELENEIKCLEMELEKQAKGFEDKLEDLARAKDEQEQRATKAEEALRKTRADSAATAERLQKFSTEMTSKVDENEKQTAKARAEANDLRVQNRLLEEMLQKSDTQLELIKAEIDAKAKHVEQIMLELENKTKQLEYAELHKEEKHEAQTMKIQMLKAEIERLTEENLNITKQEDKLRADMERTKKLVAENQALIQTLNIEKHDLEKRLASTKQESVKTHEELANMKSSKDDKETRITHLKSELDKLHTQYNESKSTLRKEALEKQNLSKQILQLQAALKKEGRISNAEKKVKKSNGQAAISNNNLRKSEESAEGERKHKDLVAELTLLKEQNASMEKELKEMEERYSEVSLQFAEVESERGQLVMAVRNLSSNKN